jgi:Flp pilus assembly protein TadD
MLALTACQSQPGPAVDTANLRQPDDQLIANTMAGAAERSGDLASAQQYYGRIIAEGKGKLNTYERRGDILLSLGVPQEAAAVYAQALQAGFDSLEIRRGYGRALAWLGQGEAALVQYDAALAKGPGDVRSMNGRGVALDMLMRHDQAQSQYRSAMAAAPGDLAVQNNLAMSLALSGKVDEAVVILERINASGASSVQHRQNLALLYGLLGRADKAADLARRDLPPDMAAQNLSAYATLQHLYEGSRAPEVTAVPAAPVTAAPLPPAAVTSAQAAVAPPPTPAPVRQPWVLDLGLFESDAGARDAWARLKQPGHDQFAQVVHYLEAEGAGRRLLAGPFWGEEAARSACNVVRTEGMTCDARQASAVRAAAGSAPAASADRPPQ